MASVDILISEVGELGRYQILIYILINIATIPDAFHINAGLFITPSLKHRCALPGYTSDTYAPQGPSHEYAVNSTIPHHYDNASCTTVFSQCKIYDNNYTETKCHKWVYDISMFESTATEDFGMVCEWSEWETISLMAPMIGMLLGATVFGVLSDRYGRKKIFMVSNILMAVFGIACAWAPNLLYFMIYRVLLGAFVSGVSLTVFVLGIELVGPSKRMWAGVMVNWFWAAGVAILTGLAYTIRDWHYLQLACSLPSLIFIVCIWVVPESPRWLMMHGRREEALKVIETIGKYNHTQEWNRIYRDSDLDDGVSINVTPAVQDSDKLWHLCGSVQLTVRSTVIVINWVAVTLAYYGLLVFTERMTSNIYLNFFLGGVVEFPAYGLCLVLMNRIGRRPLFSGSMIISGVTCLCSVIPVVFAVAKKCQVGEFDVASIVLSLIGRLGAASGFATLYVYSSELFPTSVRTSAMGFSSMAARLGGVAAPYIATVNTSGKLGSAFPLVVFGVFSLVAGLLSLLLPETLNTVLPDTVRDIQNIKRKKTIDNFTIDIPTITPVEDD